jgi:hypothetical protein
MAPLLEAGPFSARDGEGRLLFVAADGTLRLDLLREISGR